MEKRKKMMKNPKINEKPPNSIFKKNEISSISNILEIYLPFTLSQPLVDTITQQSALFLYNIKGINFELIEQQFKMIFDLNPKNEIIRIFGFNLLSSLWIIGVYPENPKNLVDKLVYIDSDFTYRFYTKNKNLRITKNKKNERKSSSNSRNR